MTPNEEKLASIRKRIRVLRAALEDPNMLTEISVDGVSERFDRAQASAELKELEAQEARLVGASPRVLSVGWRR